MASPDSTNKRKYDDASPPSSRRPTGFSAPILPDAAAVAKPLSSYNNVPPPATDLELAKQRAQEIAARILSSAEAKRPKTDNGNTGFDHGFVQKPPMPSVAPPMYGFQGGSQESKTIDIPNGRVGVIIGKGGETIKQLQAQSGAKIQVTRDMDADPHSQTRKVDLMGTPDQIARAEQLVQDVLAEAEAGGSGAVSHRVSGPQPGADQYVTKIPNNKVGLVIGKGGETIKSMQAQSNARIQVIPLHLPPGDTSTERTLQIDGTTEQIEIAKQLVNEVISENRARNPSMGGQYNQQGYQTRPPTSWGQPSGPPMQQPGYGYMQQPGAYPTSQPQYNTSQPQYPGYPPQPAPGGYSAGWDQTTGAPNQQAPQGGTGYDNSGYGYPQQPASSYNQQAQGYSQDGYGYAQPQTNASQGYDQQQGYGYGGVTNPTATPVDGGAQGDSTNQAPPTVQPVASQPGYGTAPPQPAYGAPSSQPAYGTQPPSGYAPPTYGAPPSAYGQPPYGSAPAQPGYGAPPYGAPAATQQGYGQQPPPQYNSSYGGYSQPPAYSADANAAPASQAAPPAAVAKASPPS